MINHIIKTIFFAIFFSHHALAVVNSDILSSHEIEEYILEKLAYNEKIDEIAFKINNQFKDKCLNKKKDLGLRFISKKEINKQLSSIGGTGLFNKIKKNNYQVKLRVVCS